MVFPCALRYSSHARSIEVTLAGRGPTEPRLRKLSDRLVRDGVIVHPVRFAFMGPEEMARAARQAELYVHAARSDRGDEARRSEAARYREVGQRYDIRSCVGELELVYRWLVTGGEFPGREPDREEEM